ncbi:hypothetical protein FH972_010549 [Carpinus fangiana]|uniref:KIB1-4 beta-propeller domain-containing protein n=1 Tax=Carpinus fangiana TaxID=176857 RepID=A0A660KQJ2_9ROSI|nr:hypothetical protein FH972_010549 [Carpinus fangiana]
MAQVSDLPEELIETILTHTTTDVVNLYNYGNVCRPWRSVVDKLLASSPPHLLVHEEGNDIRLLNIFTGDSWVCKIPDFKTGDGQPLRFPRIYSRHGWLAIKFTHYIFLYNPLSRARIRLPFRLPDHWQREIKFVLPSKQTNPAPSPIALVIGKKIMFWKSGDEEWTRLVDIPFGKIRLVDIISYKGGFCAIDYLGNVAQFEFNPLPRATKIPTAGIGVAFLSLSSIKCLVESLSADLLMVCRSWEGFFTVFKLDWETMVWGEITSLGDEAIFIAGGESVCVRAGESTVYKQNCIYFRDRQSRADNSEQSREDFRVYDMANKTIHRFSHHFPRGFERYSWFCLTT